MLNIRSHNVNPSISSSVVRPLSSWTNLSFTRRHKSEQFVSYWVSPWCRNTWVIFISHSKTYKIPFRRWTQHCCTDICRIRRLHRRANVIVRFSSILTISSMWVYTYIIDDAVVVAWHVEVFAGCNAIDCRCVQCNCNFEVILSNAMQNRTEQRTNWPSFAYMPCDRMRTKMRDFGCCLICYFPKWRRSTFYCSYASRLLHCIHTCTRPVNGVEP